MPLKETDGDGFGDYLAGNYQELIEHPFELGTPQVRSFKVNNCPHRVIISGAHRGDADRLVRDVARICETQHRLLPRPDDLRQYLFMLQLVDEGYGGLEHRESTALIARRRDMPTCSGEKPGEDYINLLGLCSHEYFHLWNVRRIRPRALADSDLSTEAYTRTLWVFEGFTSYYDDLMLVRSGVIDTDQYLQLLARLITRVARTPGRLVQSLEQSSFEAWSKFYKQDENAPNAIISYYAKGALLALALDIRLRRQGVADGLDAVMRMLWEEYGARNRGLEEDGIYRLLEQIGGDEVVVFAREAATGVGDISLEEVFGYLGISCHMEAPISPDDRGGLLEQKAGSKAIRARVTLGLVHKPNGEYLEVQSVLRDSPAEQAGVTAGDKLLALGGLQLTASGIDSLVQSMEPGVVVPLHLFRRGELKRLEIRPACAALDTCRLGLDPSADDRQKRQRAQWLWQ